MEEELWELSPDDWARLRYGDPPAGDLGLTGYSWNRFDDPAPPPPSGDPYAYDADRFAAPPPASPDERISHYDYDRYQESLRSRFEPLGPSITGGDESRAFDAGGVDDAVHDSRLDDAYPSRFDDRYDDDDRSLDAAVPLSDATLLGSVPPSYWEERYPERSYDDVTAYPFERGDPYPATDPRDDRYYDVPPAVYSSSGDPIDVTGYGDEDRRPEPSRYETDEDPYSYDDPPALPPPPPLPRLGPAPQSRGDNLGGKLLSRLAERLSRER